MGPRITETDENNQNTERLYEEISRILEFQKSGFSDARIDVTRLTGFEHGIGTLFNQLIDLFHDEHLSVSEVMGSVIEGSFIADIPQFPGDRSLVSEQLSKIMGGLALMQTDVSRFSDACHSGDLSARIDPSRYLGGFHEMIDLLDSGFNTVITPVRMASAGISSLADGKIPDLVEAENYPGDLGKLMTDLNRIAEVSKLRGEDINMLISSAIEGRLDARADPMKYPGYHGQIIEGINKMLDAFIGPMNVSAKYIERISKGDIPSIITENYHGDFNAIKNNLNSLIDIVNIRNHDIQMLIQAGMEGNLAFRADTTKYTGYNGKMIEGINTMLDAYIDPLNVAAEYVDRISKGDIPPKITEIYNGDFNNIKNNLNHCIDAMNLLMSEITAFSDEAVKGNLDFRTDATKHQGDFRKIVEGMNNVLETFIHPLKGAAKYISRISKGDIPPLITKSYNGDFNDIKNSLNQCIDAVNLLISDANMLSEAAVKGNLDVRSDPGKHQGDFRKIVEGINTTLNHVVLPIRESSRVARLYACGDFSVRVDNKLELSGEFIPFRDALNNIGIQMELMITEINRVANSYASGDFSAIFDNSLQIQGDFIPTRDALNQIGSDVSNVLKVVLSQMNELTTHADLASAGVSDVSQGADMIAQNVESMKNNAELSQDGITQVLQTMEDLTRTIGEVSVNTDGVAQLTVTADEIARGGILHANDAEQGMAGITRTSQTVHTLISEIQKEMQEIGKIVNLITDIASQTNLLALNAAIEAARAGDAGRGFAVVAAEVKSLAQDSRKSAGNISEMIASLQSRSQKAADAMVEAESAVETGNIALSGTLDAFQRLSQSVETIKEKMEIVASASEEQAASFEEITASVSEMNHQVGETAKQAIHSSAACEESLAVVDQIHSVIEEINKVVSVISKQMDRFQTRG